MQVIRQVPVARGRGIGAQARVALEGAPVEFGNGALLLGRVMTGTGILKAFDFEGNERWSRDIPADYGDFGLNWGYASSPLLHDGALYVQVLHGMKTDDPSYAPLPTARR